MKHVDQPGFAEFSGERGKALSGCLPKGFARRFFHRNPLAGFRSGPVSLWLSLLWLTFLALPSLHAQDGARQVAQQVLQAKSQQAEFQAYDLFPGPAVSARQSHANAIRDGLVFNLDGNAANAIRQESPATLQLTVPFKTEGNAVQVDLIRVSIFDTDFKLLTHKGEDITGQVDLGVHYLGMIRGNPNSLVSLSVINGEAAGFLADGTGNYVLGRLKDSETTHIIYKDTDLRQSYPLQCNMPDDASPYSPEDFIAPAARDAGDCVKVYVEAGFSVWNAFGGDMGDIATFIFGVFAQSFVLYANDGVAMEISEAVVWFEDDPYDGGDTDAQLLKFQLQRAFGFNGDIGHLVEVQNIGGLAAGFNGLCNFLPSLSLCFSGFSGTNFNNVPTYSFNVMIITHEMGHLLGSRHTHACVWNGNNTAIDGCAGYTELGDCDLPPPASPGTIMSYCDPDIDFNLGFGPQPRAVILNEIAGAGCLEVCPCNPDITAPVVSCQDVTVSLNASGNATVTAASVNNGSYDECSNVSLSLSQTAFNCGDLGANNVTLTVTDGEGNSDNCSATVTVQDVTPPTALCKNITVDLDAGGSVSISASQINNGSYDNCEPLFLSLISNPLFFNCGDVGGNNVTLYVEDGVGLITTCNATVTVRDVTPPQAYCKDISVYLGEDCTVSINGIDVDNGSSDACGIASYSVVPNSFGTGNVGDNAVVLTVTDVNGNSASCGATVTVWRRPTVLTNLGVFSGQYSDYPVLQASLIDSLSGNPLSGKTITFELGTATWTAVTDASGIATTTTRLGYPPTVLGFNYSIDVSFADDDPCYKASEDSDVFTVLQEDARLAYTGGLFVSTAGVNSSQATVLLSATILDISSTPDAAGDDDPGDISNATVTFVDRDGGVISPPLPVVPLPGDTTIGTVAWEWNVDIGAADAISYNIGIVVGNYYTRNSAEDDVVVTVSKPQGNYISGGGYIILTDSEGTMAGDDGTKCNFGFNIKFNKRGTNLQGQINVLFRRMEADGILHTYKIKGNRMQSLGIDPNSNYAEFQGKANVTDVTDPNNPVGVLGNGLFNVIMTDNGEPGSLDLIGISLHTNGGGLTFSSHWTGTATAQQLLDGGNLVVHAPNGSFPTVRSNTAGDSDWMKTDVIRSDAYPNPFRNQLIIGFSLPEDGQVTLEIISLTGEVIHSEYLGLLKRGVIYNQEFEAGSSMAGGYYIYRITCGKHVATGKVLYAR